MFYQDEPIEPPANGAAKSELKKFADGLESGDLEVLKNKIEQAMIADQLFKNPELTLTDLADKLGVNSKKVSQVINQGFNLNFNDFVNQHRTAEVIKILKSDRPNLVTLLGIAFDSGFNSKSTFNRAFKKHTTFTPKAYLEKIQMETGAKS